MSQLRMERAGLDILPEIAVASRYRIRTFEPGDEAALGHIYAASELGDATVQAVRSRLHAHPCFDPSRVFVACAGDSIVGTAAAWRSTREPGVGYLHMLGVLHAHRGNNLGAALIAKTLEYARDEGFNAQRLLTDDWRLPAIKLYLALGYDPILTDWSHRIRWRIVARKLGDPTITKRMRRVRL